MSSPSAADASAGAAGGDSSPVVVKRKRGRPKGSGKASKKARQAQPTAEDGEVIDLTAEESAVEEEDEGGPAAADTATSSAAAAAAMTRDEPTAAAAASPSSSTIRRRATSARPLSDASDAGDSDRDESAAPSSSRQPARRGRLSVVELQPKFDAAVELELAASQLNRVPSTEAFWKRVMARVDGKQYSWGYVYSDWRKRHPRSTKTDEAPTSPSPHPSAPPSSPPPPPAFSQLAAIGSVDAPMCISDSSGEGESSSDSNDASTRRRHMDSAALDVAVDAELTAGALDRPPSYKSVAFWSRVGARLAGNWKAQSMYQNWQKRHAGAHSRNRGNKGRRRGDEEKTEEETPSATPKKSAPSKSATPASGKSNSGTASPAAAAASASASGSASKAKRKRRRSSQGDDGIPLSTGRVKSTSDFPLSKAKLAQKVGYTLGERQSDEGADDSEKEVYEVEEIRGRRFNPKTLQWEYRLKWLGWPEDPDDPYWEPACDVRCPELIKAYHIRDEEHLQTTIDDAVEVAHLVDPPCVAFHRDGLCQLTAPEYSLTAAQVATTNAFVSKLFNSTLLSLSHRDQLDELRERGFDRFKMRQHERYDLTLEPKDLPFDLINNAPWLGVVKEILGGHAYLKHAGCMMSLPTSATQSWHSDGDHRDEDTHLPCWMLNVFVPLIDMRKEHGGTEFCPGSHVLHDEYIRTTQITPLLKAGQVLCFDYRIRHRGLGNRSTSARPVLYFSYSGSEAIVDEKNFDSKRRYAKLPPPVEGVAETREERLKKRRKRKGEETDEEEEEEEEEEGSEEAGHSDDDRADGASAASAIEIDADADDAPASARAKPTRSDSDVEMRAASSPPPAPRPAPAKKKPPRKSTVVAASMKNEFEELPAVISKSSLRKMPPVRSSAQAPAAAAGSWSSAISVDSSSGAAAAAASTPASKLRAIPPECAAESIVDVTYSHESAQYRLRLLWRGATCWLMAIDVLRIILPDQLNHLARVLAPLTQPTQRRQMGLSSKSKVQNWVLTAEGVRALSDQPCMVGHDEFKQWLLERLLPMMAVAEAPARANSTHPADVTQKRAMDSEQKSPSKEIAATVASSFGDTPKSNRATKEKKIPPTPVLEAAVPMDLEDESNSASPAAPTAAVPTAASSPVASTSAPMSQALAREPASESRSEQKHQPDERKHREPATPSAAAVAAKSPPSPPSPRVPVPAIVAPDAEDDDSDLPPLVAPTYIAAASMSIAQLTPPRVARAAAPAQVDVPEGKAAMNAHAAMQRMQEQRMQGSIAQRSTADELD